MILQAANAQVLCSDAVLLMTVEVAHALAMVLSLRQRFEVLMTLFKAA